MEWPLKYKMLASWAGDLVLNYEAALSTFRPDRRDWLGRYTLANSKATYSQLKEKLANKTKPTYNITFTEQEAIAFMIFWNLHPVQLGSLTQVVVQEIIGKVDRALITPPRIRQSVTYATNGAAISHTYEHIH